MLNVVMLNVVMLNGVMLNSVMASIVAPLFTETLKKLASDKHPSLFRRSVSDEEKKFSNLVDRTM